MTFVKNLGMMQFSAHPLLKNQLLLTIIKVDKFSFRNNAVTGQLDK